MRPLSPALALILANISPVTPMSAQAGAPSVSRGSGSWILPSSGRLHGRVARFAARFAVIDTQAIIYLDSSVVASPSHGLVWVSIDSVRVRVELNEILAAACGPSADSLTAFHLAVVRDSADTLFNYPTPRLAWLLDTSRVRIRTLKPSTVHCVREYAGE